VQIRSARCAQLVLGDKYAIGQTFRKLGQSPTFELLAVGFGDPSSMSAADPSSSSGVPTESGALWRRYRIAVPEFECEILEAFASRKMFKGSGEDWLDQGESIDDESALRQAVSIERQSSKFAAQRAVAPVFLVSSVIVLLAVAVIVASLTRLYSRC
jgi:hypothetical protein